MPAVSSPRRVRWPVPSRLGLVVMLGCGSACAGVPDIQTVQFEVDDARLSDAQVDRKLQAAVEALSADTDLLLLIVGHADEDNTDEYNLELSRERARSVKERMLGRDPSLEGRISISGRGEWDPTAPSDNEAGKARNRRVEFVFHYPRVCEPSFGPEFLRCESERLSAPKPLPTPEPKPQPEPQSDPEVEAVPKPNLAWTGGYVYGNGGYGIATADFLRQYGEWGVGGGYLWGWGRTFRIAVGIEFDHLIDAGFLVSSPQACRPDCGDVERSYLRLTPDVRFGAARGRLWAYARVSAGPLLQHVERQRSPVSAPETWRAGANLGIGPGFALTLWRGLFMSMDFTVSFSAIRGVNRGAGIFDGRLSLGWVFQEKTKRR